MARTASGNITLIDVTDGIDPITAFFTNENHTFTATETGVVGDRTGFSSELTAFVGQTPSIYVASFSGNNQHTITNLAYVGSPTGWGTITNNSGVISISSITDSATANVVVRVTFSVRNSIGSTITDLTQDITLSIVRQGAGGQAVALTATHQAFFADATETVIDNNATNPDVIITIDTAGQTGALAYAVSQNGGNFAARTSTGTGQGQIAAYDNDSSGDVVNTGTIPTTQSAVTRLRVTRANFGTNRTMAIQVQGASGGLDVITIFRVRQGDSGTNATKHLSLIHI